MELLKPGQHADARIAGGKGSNLLRLASASHNIPYFVVVPTEVLRKISTLPTEEKNTRIESLAAKIINELDPINSFAVRSSACSEDGALYSFAGQFKTVLNVGPTALAGAILSVFESATQTNGTAYQSFAGTGDIQPAVIVQEMIQPSASGVAFGLNPLNGDANTIVINATEGLGEKLVSGQINADTFKYDRRTGLQESDTVNASPALDQSQVTQVANLVKEVEKTFNQPQDIEFAFVGYELYLLQSRPITAKAKSRTIWDNSNIVESYPGITLALTCSFLDKVYAAVYKQLCAVLGVSHKTIVHNDALFNNLLGFINGRVYYNLNSWFGILALLPGYQLNAAFMEKMMGVKDKPQFDTQQTGGKRTLRDYVQVLNAFRCIITNLNTANKQRLRFLKEFDSVYSQFNNIDHDTLTIEQLWDNYRSFEKLMVERWKAPLVNDFFTMIYFGILQKLCIKHQPEAPNTCNELIASSKDIITTEPAKQLPRLAFMINQNHGLKKIFLSNPSSTVWQILKTDPSYSKESAAIGEYLSKWGERSVAELKLETLTYKQLPQNLVEVLQSYLQNEVFSYPENHEADINRITAEKKMMALLRNSPIQKMIFRHVLKKARYFITNRENLRYYRTKGFGLVREMMIALGKKLKDQQLLNKERDIFFLKLNDLKEVIENHNHQSLAHIEKTKAQFAVFETMPAEERITTYTSDKYFTYPVGKAKDATSGLLTLTGIPCSAGIVQARVRLVTHTGNLNVLNGDIMATYATDPGWVVLFPSAAGILTERGSLLSHAAIVSREMGIPCIVGITGLMEQLKDGDTILMDGSTGVVNLLSKQ